MANPKSLLKYSSAPLIFLLILIAAYFQIKTPIPALHTSGNDIIQKNNKEPITLKGVTSDYFRYDFNYDYPEKYGGLEKELERLHLLKKSGVDINLIILYLSRPDLLKENIAELDRYIKYAGDNGLYVMLAPAGVGFLETNPRKLVMDENYWNKIKTDDLYNLTSFLASRYGREPHILFQLVAEPNMDPPEWKVIQEKLAGIVRHYSNNPIVLSTSYYSRYDPLPALPLENIIYSTGGYVRKNDISGRERTVSEILGESSLVSQYPVIVAEFGGNYGGDFSTKSDLDMYEEILGEVNKNEMSYSMYRLSSAFEHDGLALFDVDNKLTSKGKIFVKMFK